MRDFLHRLYPYQVFKIILQRLRPIPVATAGSASLPLQQPDEHPFDPIKTRAQLVTLFRTLKEASPSTTNSTHDQSRTSLPLRRQSIFQQQLGFHLEVGPSRISNAGQGVFLRRAPCNSETGVRIAIKPGSVVAMYPGTLYRPGEAIFFNSINNRYILKCNDGIYVDGKAKGMSGSIFRSINGRDNYPGITATADTTWMVDWSFKSRVGEGYAAVQASEASVGAERPRIGTGLLKNPLAVGQIVNNGMELFPPNVRYQELDVRTRNFPLELQEFLPNIWYSGDWHAHDHDHDFESEEDESVDWSKRSSSDLDHLRTVVLITTRSIEEDEELYSTYIEQTH
ncbi:hypothetical protein EDD21DRAFT_108389 [Dissophora ornata]|nr:SET domain-containing protein 9 [Dissophora ornata]KAI8601411.1 hypothetical protein EDD21DRAFT_108389 [Dissophora ornata]